MGRFVYSLDRLLMLRTLQERQLELKTRPIVSKINLCLENIEKSKNMQERVIQHSKDLQLSSQKMVQYLSYTRDMSIKKIRSQEVQLKQYEQQYEKEYVDLVRQARMRRRSLEILREKQLLEHKKLSHRKEEKEVEDHVCNKQWGAHS